MTLTREEWQENPAIPIDSVMEAEGDIRDRNDLIRLMGRIVYLQNKIIQNACSKDGEPRVIFTDIDGMEWRYSVVRLSYLVLMDELLPQLPKDWIETLEV